MTNATNPKFLCLFGIAIWVASLLCPAVNHGNTMYGYECFAMTSFITVYFPFAPNLMRSDPMVFISVASFLLHFLSFLLIVRVIFGIKLSQYSSTSLFIVILLLVFYISTGPYDGIEENYIGFYLWLLSLLLIGLTSLQPISKVVNQTKEIIEGEYDQEFLNEDDNPYKSPGASGSASVN